MSTQKEHKVIWEIDVEATSKVEAANIALAMLCDMQSLAHAFEVACEGDTEFELVDLDDNKETAESFRSSKSERVFTVSDIIAHIENDIEKGYRESLRALIKSIHPSLLREYLGV